MANAASLPDEKSETHCNIDLVSRVGGNSYEFIELKYDDATPVFADLYSEWYFSGESRGDDER